MYEEWENLAHQGVLFTISYRQQVYEVRSEIITTLIDCFSELNKHTRSYPETELVWSPGEKYVTFPITLGSFSTLIMFYRRIIFSDAAMSFQSCQHQHTPHLSMTWRQFTESMSCLMHGGSQIMPYKRLQYNTIDCFSELNKHTRSYPETELGVSPGENTVTFPITLGSFSTLIMFYRRIIFSDAAMSYQSCQHQRTPHLSMTWRQFTESMSCLMHGGSQIMPYRRLQ